MRCPLAGRLPALLRKEALQIIRDPSAILIAFVLPPLMLFLFGTAVSFDATRLPIALVMQDDGAAAQDLAAGFEASPVLAVTRFHARAPAMARLEGSAVRGVIVIPSGFSARFAADPPSARIQVLTDGSEPNTASFVAAYAEGVHAAWLARGMAAGEITGMSPPLSVAPRVWFNAELASRNYLVPGSIAIVMTLIGTLLTALVIAREWERGTMEALIATPVTRLELLLSKVLPYFALGLCSLALCAAASVFAFGVPMRGSFGALLLLAAAFLCPALGLGLLISAALRNQFVASQVALFAGFLPAMLLSGFIFEIDSMPAPIRWITVILPARYFVPGLQTIFLAGDVWPLLLPAIAAMLLIGIVLLGLTARALVKRLD